MKYFSAAILILFVIGSLAFSMNSVLNSNLPVSPSQQVREYLVSSGESFSIIPNGEFVFTRSAVVDCESRKPFSITGKASGVDNTIVQYHVAGRYMVSGSTVVHCSFHSYDALPIAYAVLNPKALVMLYTGIYVFGLVMIFISLIVSCIAILKN